MLSGAFVPAFAGISHCEGDIQKRTELKLVSERVLPEEISLVPGIDRYY